MGSKWTSVLRTCLKNTLLSCSQILPDLHITVIQKARRGDYHQYLSAAYIPWFSIRELESSFSLLGLSGQMELPQLQHPYFKWTLSCGSCAPSERDDGEFSPPCPSRPLLRPGSRLPMLASEARVDTCTHSSVRCPGQASWQHWLGVRKQILLQTLGFLRSAFYNPGKWGTLSL